MKKRWIKEKNENIEYEKKVFRKEMEDLIIMKDGIGVDIERKVFYGERFKENINGKDLVKGIIKKMKRKMKIGMMGGLKGVEEKEEKILKKKV